MNIYRKTMTAGRESMGPFEPSWSIRDNDTVPESAILSMEWSQESITPTDRVHIVESANRDQIRSTGCQSIATVNSYFQAALYRMDQSEKDLVLMKREAQLYKEEADMWMKRYRNVETELVEAHALIKKLQEDLEKKEEDLRGEIGDELVCFEEYEESALLYVIPEDIKGLIKKDLVPGILKEPLSPQTYKDYFAALLYAEDYYLEKWDGFEMENVTLKLHEAEAHGRRGNSKKRNNDQKNDKILVEFEVDAIPERRPFLLPGDFASVRPSDKKVDPLQGIINRVLRGNIVLVEFGDDFHPQHYFSCKYDVKFSFNRECIKRAHQSIAAASGMLFKKFLFPAFRPKDPFFIRKNSFIQKLLFSSYELDSAANAITRIITLSGPPAYLVEGPLTVTRDKQLSRTGLVVQNAVLQLCQASAHNRILICAPLNSTCDVFMRSLRKEVSDTNFLPFYETDEVFSCPSLSQLLKFKVILSTFMSSFRLHSEGIDNEHFTHIFLVDASSVIEPEAMVPLSNLTNASTNVVVTGARRNHSDWVCSDIARQNGLKTSYFQRLRNSTCYRDLDPESITQLEVDSSPWSSYSSDVYKLCPGHVSLV